MPGLERQTPKGEVNLVFILQVAFLILFIVFLACLALASPVNSNGVILGGI